MQKIIRAVLVSALLGGPTATAAAQSVEKGQEVFTTQKCTICHSIAGKGNAKGVLDAVGAKLTADEIRQWVTEAPAMAAKAKAERKPPMRAFTLPKDELDALVAYLASLKK